MKLQNVQVTFVICLISVCVFASCQTMPPQSMAPTIQKGDFPPDLLGLTIDGHEVHLSHLKGKVVLIIFWKSSCNACKIMLQKANVLQYDFQNNFVLVAVNMGEPHTNVRAFKRLYRLDFLVLLDPHLKISSSYGIQAWPTNILINQQGFVHFISVGHEMELLRQEIETLLQFGMIYEKNL